MTSLTMRGRLTAHSRGRSAQEILSEHRVDEVVDRVLAAKGVDACAVTG